MATDTSTRALGWAPKGTRLVERLGIGSVFEVALLADEENRELIGKRIAPHARTALGALALERERDLLSAAKSEHAPELVAWGTDERGGFLIETRAPGTGVREFVLEGESAWDATRWLTLARACTRALARLHALADADGDLLITHGDISPDNLFFEAPGRVTFIDFSSATYRTAPKPVFPGDRGTLPYAAPELVRNEVPATQETDTYALAATLLAIAVGPITRATTDASRLFEVANEGVLWQKIETRSDLPPSARYALAEALQFERGSRLTSARELAERFDPTPR
jgi:hypothetical protein